MALKNPRAGTAYPGVRAANPPDAFSVPRAPTTSDYKNFEVMDLWRDKSVDPPDMWILVARERSAVSGNIEATWVKFVGGGGDLIFLTGDVGGPVGPDAASNINLVGGFGIATTGVPATNTISFDIDADIAEIFETDAGNAVPAAGILQVLGGTNVNTAGAGNTVTINADGALANEYVTDAGTAVPVAGTLNVLGGTGIDTAGAGNTITINADGGDPSAFAADITVAIPNVTGDGTIYEIIFNRTHYNIGGDFDTINGYYVAPVDGVYEFNCTISVDLIGNSGYTSGIMTLEVKGTGPCVGQWAFSRKNPFAISDSTTDAWRENGSVTVQLDAGDTVNAEVSVAGGPKTVRLNIGSGGPPSRTFMTGSKLFDI